MRLPVLLSLLVVASGVHANVVTWRASGTVTGIDNPYQGVGTGISASIGDPFSIDFDVDLSAQDVQYFPTYIFHGAVVGARVQIGSSSLDIPVASWPGQYPQTGVNIYNDDNVYGDLFRLAANSQTEDGPTDYVALALLTSSGSQGGPLDSLALPTEPPDPAQFDGIRMLSLSRYGETIRGSFETLHAVPLPPTDALLGAGLLCMVALLRRSSANARHPQAPPP